MRLSCPECGKEIGEKPIAFDHVGFSDVFVCSTACFDRYENSLKPMSAPLTEITEDDKLVDDFFRD